MANTDPIYSRVADIQGADISATANTALDGTGTVSTVFTADAVNGGFVQYLKLKPKGTTALTTIRVYLNNGGVTTTATNNFLFEELTLPAVTISQTAANVSYAIPMNIALPPGWRVIAHLTATATSAWACTAIGGKY